MASALVAAAAEDIALAASWTTLYTCPADPIESTIHTINFSNKTAASVDVSIRITDADGTTVNAVLLWEAPVPVGSSLVTDKAYNIEATKKLQVQASTASAIDCYASIAELT